MPLLEQEYLEQVAQEHIQRAVEDPQGGRLHSLSRQPVPGLCDLQREPPVFQSVPTASCPATGHHWEKSDPAIFTPSQTPSDISYISKISVSFPFSRLSSLSYVKQSIP